MKPAHNKGANSAIGVAVAEVLELPLATLDMSFSRTRGPKCKFLTPEDR